MLNEKMMELGKKSSVIREIFEYGKKRKAEISSLDIRGTEGSKRGDSIKDTIKDETVNIEEEIITYSVTNNLTNVTSDNANLVVTENSSYTANLSTNSGYTLDTVTVTMGGSNITATAYIAATGVVKIDKVTGNIVITVA